MTTESILSLASKVAVVTGGSSGIGAASVSRLAAAGARVVVGYNSGAARAAALIGELPGDGHRAIHLPMEDSAQIHTVAAGGENGFGRADILVNSAGFTRMIAHADLDTLDDDLIDAILAANVRGPVATIRAFVPLLRRSGGWGDRQHFVDRRIIRNRQQHHLWRLEGRARYDEHGLGAR